MTATVENSPGVAEWVKILRETDKPQTTGALHDKNGFCCLGIWCDYLASKDDFEISVTKSEQLFTYYDGSYTVLPLVTQKALGEGVGENPSVVIRNPRFGGDTCGNDYEIDDEGTEYYRPSNPRYLVNDSVAELNDDAGLTFNQIADLVEYAGLD